MKASRINIREAFLFRIHMAFSKSNLCLSEGACLPRPKSLLAVVETLRYAQGDMSHFFQVTLRRPYSYPCYPLT